MTNWKEETKVAPVSFKGPSHDRIFCMKRLRKTTKNLNQFSCMQIVVPTWDLSKYMYSRSTEATFSYEFYFAEPILTISSYVDPLILLVPSF
jgi:hypothetical protein